MAKITITDGILIDYTADGWAEYVQWLDGTRASLRYVYEQTAESYLIVAIDGQVRRTFSVDVADAGPFEAAYKADADASPTRTLTRIDGPVEGDGKPVVVMAPNTTGFMTWFTGRGDDVGSPPGRGEGQAFAVEWDAVEARGTKVVEAQFVEPVELHDGEMFYGDGGLFGGWTAEDEFSFSAALPATPVTPNAQTAGNCNLVPIGGGANLIVPAAGDGTHDVDLAEAVPVPAGFSPAGYWDADYRTGTVTPSASPGKADWHLLDVPQESFFLKRMPLGNPIGVFEIDTYKAEWIHPLWKLRLSVTKNSAGSGQLAGWLMLFREHST